MQSNGRRTDSKIRDFQDLEVWQMGKRLALAAYELTATFPASETYGLTSQIRRAALSAPANVAEGFGRFHFADRIKFLFNARGSLNELKSHMLIARDLNLVEESALRRTICQIELLSVKLNNYIAALRRSSQRNTTTRDVTTRNHTYR